MSMAQYLIEQRCDCVTWDESCADCNEVIDAVAERWDEFPARVFDAIMRHDSAADQLQDIAAALLAEGFIIP